jgi:hypothetical protein
VTPCAVSGLDRLECEAQTKDAVFLTATAPSLWRLISSTIPSADNGGLLGAGSLQDQTYRRHHPPLFQRRNRFLHRWHFATPIRHVMKKSLLIVGMY